LTYAQQQIRIDRSIDLLKLLESAQANPRQSFMILDESWFYFWTSKDNVVMIAWHPHGFHVVDAFLKGEGWNNPSFIEHIVQQILEYRPMSGCANLSFMQTIPNRTRARSPEQFVSLIPSESHRILRIRRIQPLNTFFRICQALPDPSFLQFRRQISS
jgi:hypothetical protein